MSRHARAHHPRSHESVIPAKGSPVVWRDVVVFVLLAYGIAWGIWSPLTPKILVALASGQAPAQFQATGGVVIGMYAPTVAAVIMRLFVSREGLRTSLKPWPLVRHILLAIVIPMLFIFALVLAVTALKGASAFTPGKPLATLLPVMLVAGVPVGALLAFGEEYGWRGYLLRKLLPLGELKAGLVVGVIWSLWHLPILIVGLNYPGENIAALVAVFLLATILLSLLHTRFYVISGGSVIVTAVLHGSLNTFSDRLTDPKHLAGAPLVVGGGGVIAIALGVIAAIITALWLHQRQQKSQVGPITIFDSAQR